MTRLLCFVIAIMLAAAAPALSQGQSRPAVDDELAAISKRGRILAKMQTLKDSATDLLLTKKQQYSDSATTDGAELSVQVQLPPFGETKVVYGRLGSSQDTYFIDFVVTGNNGNMAIKTFSPPLEDHQYFLAAARALSAARQSTEGWPGSYLVLPLDKNHKRFYVYLYPRDKGNAYLLGGDKRYKVILDGDSVQIAEKKQLHQATLTYQVKKNARFSYHSAVIGDKPEDTDVLHVLTRKPALPELVSTANYLYRIETDGQIKFVDKINHLKQRPR